MSVWEVALLLFNFLGTAALLFFSSTLNPDGLGIRRKQHYNSGSINAQFTANRVRDRCNLFFEQQETHVTLAFNDEQQRARPVRSSTQRCTNTTTTLPVNRETTQNSSGTHRHHSNCTPFIHFLLPQGAWDQRGDPPLRYRDQCICLRGYHL